MKSAAQLEKAVLSLPPAERAHLALAAWESLESDPSFAANPAFDPEGIALAQARDREIESGAAQPLTHEEFLARTGGAKKR
jgi:hypothetical protein